MISLAITLGSIVAYCLIGSAIGAKATLMFKKRSTSRYSDLGDFALGGVFVGLFWPVAMWLLVGARLLDRELAKDARREAELKAREESVRERERLMDQARRELQREGLA